MAVVAGGAFSYLNLEGQNREARSPGLDLMASRKISQKLWLITELRYVYTRSRLPRAAPPTIIFMHLDPTWVLKSA